MPIKMLYRVEFYNGAISDKDVVNSFEPATVPYAFSIGDFVDPFGWGGKNPLPRDEHYQITSVEHQLTLPDSPQEGLHNVAVSLKAVKRDIDAVA
jgi:hypothetical protein